MQYSLISALLAATATTACTIPGGTLSNTITKPFGVLIQNPKYPAIHNKYMNLNAAGGGDRHLFLEPVPDPVRNLTLAAGVLTWPDGGIHAVIDGEYSAVDNTTKMFMTERGDPRAIFQPVYGCNPDNNDLQTQLKFVTRETSPTGGGVCLRIASGNRGYEFRYTPPNNPASDPTNFCMPATLIVIPEGTTISTGTVRPTTTAKPATPSKTTSKTTSSTKAPTASALPFTDMTSSGFSFVGCAPEERTAPNSPTGRTLVGSMSADDAMTEEKCIAFCKSGGYKYAGTEYTRECWCGNAVAAGRTPPSTAASLANCNFKCGGSASEYCGGNAYLSLYKSCAAGAACVNAKFT
ncbi:WSC domain-containing [Hyphodiscus hymeniophilus]|uniref:WSC domain-containing n=1 Tax=Hyphodiscus hymeniophilus TaxID=353542 RepID=A0A9P6VKU4_9HELO|nr:WSC domain-containing [Hyphodiscus hymeniophilus]